MVEGHGLRGSTSGNHYTKAVEGGDRGKCARAATIPNPVFKSVWNLCFLPLSSFITPSPSSVREVDRRETLEAVPTPLSTFM